ncbi:MAG TPA: hypothetical protein VGN08_08065 [Solirubrobacteraceae bacterium]|jgi:hypothetical protein
MGKHLTYANVAATLALVLSMSGGALAANHYLINSTRQINPRVLKRLRGPQGPAGPAGPATLASGPVGATGAPGGTGPAGTARAFGAVAATGLLSGPSRNVAGVAEVATGKYCIAPSEPGISPSGTLIVVALDASGTNAGNALARSHPVNCPAGQFEVDTIVYRETGGGILSEYHPEPFTFTIP